MTYMEKSLDSGQITYQQYSHEVSAKLQKMFEEGKLSAQDYFSYQTKLLEQQKSVYDKVLSAVTRRFDKEIDYYNDLIDGVEKQNDALEDQKQQMENAAQAVSDYYQSLMDSQQEVIHGLETENEQLEEQLSEYDKILSAVDRVYETEQNAITQQQEAIQEKTGSCFIIIQLKQQDG